MSSTLLHRKLGSSYEALLNLLSVHLTSPSSESPLCTKKTISIVALVIFCILIYICKPAMLTLTLTMIGSVVQCVQKNLAVS